MKCYVRYINHNWLTQSRLTHKQAVRSTFNDNNPDRRSKQINQLTVGKLVYLV